MNGIVSLVIGFLAGGIAASAVWALVVSGKNRAAKAQRLEKEQIMASVGETLAEADAVETRYRSGALTAEEFRRSLGDKVNAVMRLLRTNMHALDAFFVKYAEQEARDYLRVIDNPERRRPDEALPPPLHAPAPIAPEPAAWQPDSGASMRDTDVSPIIDAPVADAGFEPSADANFEPSADAGFEPSADANFEPSADAEFEPSADADFEPSANADFEPSADADFEPDGFAPPTATETDVPSLPETSVVSREEPAAPHVVSEEELVLGESVDAAGMPIAPMPAAPDEDTFDVSPPAPAPAAAQDDFEAAFAQFEVGAAPQPQRAHADANALNGAGAQQLLMETPVIETTPPPYARADEHVMTETSSIDKHAIQNAMGGAPTFTPLQPPLPQPTEDEARATENQGITGDDVIDSIDNFFNLK